VYLGDPTNPTSVQDKKEPVSTNKQVKFVLSKVSEPRSKIESLNNNKKVKEDLKAPESGGKRVRREV